MTRRQRRAMGKEWQALFEQFRAASKKYGQGDPFNTLETFDLFEDCDDDKPADVLIACDLLEHLPDPDAVLWRMKKLARKQVCFMIETDEIRSVETWKAIIGKHFAVSAVTPLQCGKVWINASCINPFGQNKIVAAGTIEGRWDNILSNIRAVQKRVQLADAHGRHAIVACYGPSIRDNLGLLKTEARSDNADVISVSGSHDFLITNGIVPAFHVECDPRPHKADNIARGVEDVRYLLGSIVHPILIDKLSGLDVSLWHPSGEFNLRIVDEIEPDATFVGVIGNVGLASLSLFYRMGYRAFSIYGMDCSFAGEEKWAGPHAQKKNPTEQKIIEVMCGGRQFFTAAVYLAYANAFFDLIKVLPDAQFNIYGDNLLQQMSRIYMQQSEAA